MAPDVPVAGTSTVSIFNEKLQVALRFLENIASYAMGGSPEYSLMIPVRSEDPRGV